MKASEVMTRRVVSVHPDAKVAQVARLMLQHHISGLPVVNSKGKLVGMVTEGDLLRRAEIGTERHRPSWLEFLIGPGRAAEDYVHAHTRRVEEVMSSGVISVTPGTALDEIVALMERRRIKRLPVIDGEHLVGIVSRADLLRAFAKTLAKPLSPYASDEGIKEKILARIDQEPWAPRATITIGVVDGIVEIRGVVTDERERAALRVLAENVPGVKGIRDELVWVEPISGMTFGAGHEAAAG